MRLHPPIRPVCAPQRAGRELGPVDREAFEIGVGAKVEHDLLLRDERLDAVVESLSAVKKSTCSIACSTLDRKDDHEIQ